MLPNYYVSVKQKQRNRKLDIWTWGGKPSHDNVLRYDTIRYDDIYLRPKANIAS